MSRPPCPHDPTDASALLHWHTLVCRVTANSESVRLDNRYGSHTVYNIEYHFVWGAGVVVVPDPEVMEKAGRRRFTASTSSRCWRSRPALMAAAETLGNAPGAAAEADP